ncbi:hypothetical protein [Nocardia sp. NPDC004722]
MKLIGAIFAMAVMLCTGCGSHSEQRSAPTTTSPTQQTDPIHEIYLQVQEYVQQHPEAAHYFDARPGDAYQGPNLVADWSNMCDPTGVALNAWYDDYARFEWAANKELGSDKFGPLPPGGAVALETMQCHNFK